MASIPHHSTFFRECLKRVSRNEPRGRDVVFFKQLQKPANANRAGEKS